MVFSCLKKKKFFFNNFLKIENFSTLKNKSLKNNFLLENFVCRKTLSVQEKIECFDQKNFSNTKNENILKLNIFFLSKKENKKSLHDNTRNQGVQDLNKH